MKGLLILIIASFIFIGCSKDEDVTDPDNNQNVNDSFITGKWVMHVIENKDTLNADMNLAGKDTSFTGSGKSYVHIMWDQSTSYSFTGDVSAEGSYTQTKISITFNNGMTFSGIRTAGGTDKKFIGDLTVKYWISERTYHDVAFSKSE